MSSWESIFTSRCSKKEKPHWMELYDCDFAFLMCYVLWPTGWKKHLYLKVSFGFFILWKTSKQYSFLLYKLLSTFLCQWPWNDDQAKIKQEIHSGLITLLWILLFYMSLIYHHFWFHAVFSYSDGRVFRSKHVWRTAFSLYQPFPLKFITISCACVVNDM